MSRIPSLLVLILPCAVSCSSPDPLGPEVSFGVLQDALGGEGPGLELSGALPAAFLVGDAAAADHLMELRAQQAAASGAERLVTILDVSPLADLDRTSLTDRLLEPALEPGGPVLLDAVGATCFSLRGGHPGSWLVHVDAARRITARESLAPAQ